VAKKLAVLLSPAGDMESLKAAIYAGADEVYFGLSDFNARKGAKNFSINEAKEAILLCRLYGVKVNITLNTLLYAGEYSAAVRLVDEMEKDLPPDAYIIQDIGLAYELKLNFPHISLHASTQMQVHGSYGNNLLKRLGFTRIVLAREMAREDIKIFASSGIETEVFVHGALCVCRSGGCLMSSMIGKRSGNRGECAYPCRMKYNGGYPLSLKDNCLAGKIPDLIDMGVDAFKIEGRMKSPEYVYGVTRVYRTLIDENRPATPDEMKYLSELFSRSGFTDGYYTNHLGKGMFGVRTEADKEKTRKAEINIAERKIPLFISAKAEEGKPVGLTLSADDIKVTAKGFVPEKAISKGTTKEEVLKQLTKLGNTVFFAERAEINPFAEGFYPVSALNSLRREAVGLLEKEIIAKNIPKKHDFTPIEITLPEKSDNGLVLRFEGDVINRGILNKARRIEVPLWKESLWEGLLEYKDRLSLILPGFIFDSKIDNIKRLIKKAKDAGITRLTLPNLTFISLCDGFKLHGDFQNNCLTQRAAGVLYALGFETVCASPEAKTASWENAEKIIYGNIPLMNTRNCVIKNCSSCVNGKSFYLTDRTGAAFPVFCGYEHSNIIYNSVPLWLLDRPVGCSPVIIFTTESQKRQAEIIDAFEKKKAPEGKFTRGYA
jgi:putative protease